ncbi:Crp/Fnr family transcriptional regulator [Pseudovibrio sp. POLY-S9]|uniref:Crp/Fnr family transcriptional regulator n=1 Tax=Pseudovibrio sp. POLY-S9 TaxID=1576596 RepID=UPI000A9EDF1C|nr:Crp/Fnr family transcriptional regulator [Pseudovibrio sp. POLY-S9]
MSTTIVSSEVEKLAEIPLLKRLSTEAREQLLRGATKKSVSRGEMIFFQDDKADAFFIVLEGWVKVFRATSSGDEAVVGVFTRGQTFAEGAAFTNSNYPASGEAVTDSVVLCIPVAHLANSIAADPNIALAMMSSLSMHLHQLVLQIEGLKTHTGAQRVAEFLLNLSTEPAGSCTLVLPYDKALIAGRLGMKPESLSRAFQKLKSYGVEVKQNRAIISNVQVLRTLVEQERTVVMHSNHG